MCGGWGVPEDDELSPDEGDCGKKKATEAGVDKSKRGFTTAAMASPVLMSLLSKPAWSQAACSISGLTSGNVSSPGGEPGPCDGMGCTPGYWKNNPEAWFINTPYSPGTCAAYQGQSCKEWTSGTGDIFLTVFGCAPLIGEAATTTLMDILQLAVKDSGNVVSDVNHAMQAHWVAALLNASAAPLAYGSDAQQIIDVVCAAAYGTPVNGVIISVEQLHATLELMNERGCLMNAHGFCEENQVNNQEGQCIPACPGNTRFDVNQGTCIENSSWVDGVNCSVQDAIDGQPWCSLP